MKCLKEETIKEVINLANRCCPPDKEKGKVFNFPPDKEGFKKAFEQKPEEEKLENFIDGLSNDEKTELLALMWLGRDGGEWEYLINHAREELDDVALYITEKASALPLYLNRGVERARAINLF